MLGNMRCQTTIAVSDMDRAKKFWVETLGLKELETTPGGVDLEAGNGSRVELYPSSFAGTAKSTVIGFTVDDLAATMTGLRERGVTFEEYDTPEFKTENGVGSLGPIRVAWFKDPDGNIVGLIQPG